MTIGTGDDRLKGRNVDEMDRLKSFVKAEDQRKQARGEGSDDDVEDPGVKRMAKKKGKQQGVWRRGKFITMEEKAKQDAEKRSHAYRDRALERRKGLHKDYSEEVAALAAVELDAEQSKFLGGDVEHTFLVKGLDYALLQKVRRDAEMKAKEIKEKEEATAAETASKKRGQNEEVESLSSSFTVGSEVKGDSLKDVRVRTQMGHAVLSSFKALRGQSKPKDLNLLTYEFNTTNVDELLRAPIAVYRPKADWEKTKLEDRRDGAFDFDAYASFETKDVLIHKLSEGLARGRQYLKGGGKKRKRKGEGGVNGISTLNQANTQSIDIFADVGLGSVSSTQRLPLSNGSKSVKAIFDDLGKWTGEEDDIDIVPNKEQIAKSIKLVAKAAERKGGVYSSKVVHPSLADGEYEDYAQYGAGMLVDDESHDLKDTTAGGTGGGGGGGGYKKKTRKRKK